MLHIDEMRSEIQKLLEKAGEREVNLVLIFIRSLLRKR